MSRPSPATLATHIVNDAVATAIDFGSEFSGELFFNARYEKIIYALRANLPEQISTDEYERTFDQLKAMSGKDGHALLLRLDNYESQERMLNQEAAYLLGIAVGSKLCRA